MSNHIKNDLKMSTTTLDPVELLLNKADQGNLIIKNPNVLRHDYIPTRILHRDKQQEWVPNTDPIFILFHPVENAP